jgi:hypothetical protein
MATFRVVQTVEAFRYPVGKIWGPYAERIDAEERIATLRKHKGDGVIEFGDFGTPCAQAVPVPDGGLSPKARA